MQLSRFLNRTSFLYGFFIGFLLLAIPQSVFSAIFTCPTNWQTAYSPSCNPATVGCTQYGADACYFQDNGLGQKQPICCYTPSQCAMADPPGQSDYPYSCVYDAYTCSNLGGKVYSYSCNTGSGPSSNVCCGPSPTPTPTSSPCTIGTCGGCGITNMRYVTGSSQTCGSWYTGDGCYYFNTCTCTNGANCSVCSATVANTCSSQNGTQMCTLTSSNNGNTYCANKTVTQTCSTGGSGCSRGYTCINNAFCGTTIAGQVNQDQNNNGIVTPYAGEVVTGTNNLGQQTTDQQGTYQFNAVATGNYTLTASVPSGYVVSSPNPFAVTLGNTSGNAQVNFTLIPLKIEGVIFIDYNHNGTQESDEPLYTAQGGNLAINNFAIGGAGNTGIYSYLPGVAGTYTISYTPPPGYQLTTSASEQVTLSSSTPQAVHVNFGITPLYTISGTIFNDVNKDKQIDNGEQGIKVGSINIIDQLGKTIVSPSILDNGTYATGQLLTAGQYDITYALPQGMYSMTYPIPSTLHVSVGLPNTSIPCGTNNVLSLQCDQMGNIIHANFGITNEHPFIQGFCTDLRNDNGFSDQLPTAPGSPNSCGGVSSSYASLSSGICTNPGVIFSGNNTPDFGQGVPSTQGWIAENENFKPVNTQTIRTSYAYMLDTIRGAGITPIDLSSFCSNDLLNCTLSSNFANGVYLASGDTLLHGYTFSDDKNYVILINGNLTIDGNLLVPNGSTVTFSVSGTISIAPTVGEVDTTSQDANIQGFYSTDRSFIVETSATNGETCQSDGTSIDKRLNITGSVVVNAADNGGTFSNQRDLCLSDLSCPVTTIGFGNGNVSGKRIGAGNGLTYLLNAPSLLKHSNFVWKEISP